MAFLRTKAILQPLLRLTSTPTPTSRCSVLLPLFQQQVLLFSSEGKGKSDRFFPQNAILTPTPTSRSPVLLHPLFQQQVLLFSSKGKGKGKSDRFFPQNAQPSQNTRKHWIRAKKGDKKCTVCKKPFVTQRLMKRSPFRWEIYCNCGKKNFLGGVTHDKCPRCGLNKFNVKKGSCLNCTYRMPLSAVRLALRENKKK